MRRPHAADEGDDRTQHGHGPKLDTTLLADAGRR
jgi:hypothetical protein